MSPLFAEASIFARRSDRLSGTCPKNNEGENQKAPKLSSTSSVHFFRKVLNRWNREEALRPRFQCERCKLSVKRNMSDCVDCARLEREHVKTAYRLSGFN